MRLLLLVLASLSLSHAFARPMDLGFAIRGSQVGVNITTYNESTETYATSKFVAIAGLVVEDDSISYEGVECAYLKDMRFFGMKRVKETGRCVIEMNGSKVTVRTL